MNSFGESDFQSNGVLSLGDFQSGKQTPYADYFDPTVFVKMINFLKINGTPPSNINVPNNEPSPVYNASVLQNTLMTNAQATWTWLSQSAASNGGWITNSIGNTGGVGGFGYEATRALMRMGQYMLYCQKNGSDPLGILEDDSGRPGVISTLKTLVSNLFSQGGFVPAMIVHGVATSSINFANANSPSGFSSGAISGPLAVALLALQKDGQLPANVTPAIISNVDLALNFDATNYDGTDQYNPPDSAGGFGNNWQETDYFPICLATISQQIMAAGE